MIGAYLMASFAHRLVLARAAARARRHRRGGRPPGSQPPEEAL
jgi:hypothetical protein